MAKFTKDELHGLKKIADAIKTNDDPKVQESKYVNFIKSKGYDVYKDFTFVNNERFNGVCITPLIKGTQNVLPLKELKSLLKDIKRQFPNIAEIDYTRGNGIWIYEKYKI